MVKCYNCKEMGQYARDCLKKNTQQRSKTTHKAKAPDVEGTEERDVTDNVFTAGSHCLSDTWFANSGASSLLTWKRDLVTDYDKFKVLEKVGL